MICSAPIGFHCVTAATKMRLMQAGPDPEGARWGGGAPNFLKLSPNENCVKGIQVRKQGWGEEVHHIPHTRVNSCRETGFSRGGGSQPKNWANLWRGVGLGCIN